MADVETAVEAAVAHDAEAGHPAPDAEPEARQDRAALPKMDAEDAQAGAALASGVVRDVSPDVLAALLRKVSDLYAGASHELMSLATTPMDDPNEKAVSDLERSLEEARTELQALKDRKLSGLAEAIRAAPAEAAP